jgi:hypothetical protein
MITRLAGALGVAALALSFTLGHSFACPKAAETTSVGSETVTRGAVADAAVATPEILEPKGGETAPLNAAEGSVAEAAAIAPAVAAPPVEMPETAVTVIPVQRQDAGADLALTDSIEAIVGKIEPSSDGSETSILTESDVAEWKLIFDPASAPTTASDVAEWKLIFDAVSAPTAAVIEASAGAAPATIRAVEAIPAEPVEATSPASDRAPASPEIEITGAVPQHTAATEDLE